MGVPCHIYHYFCIVFRLDNCDNLTIVERITNNLNLVLVRELAEKEKLFISCWYSKDVHERLKAALEKF
jgi:hypothetical protein